MQGIPPPPPGFTIDTSPMFQQRPVYRQRQPEAPPRHPDQERRGEAEATSAQAEASVAAQVAEAQARKAEADARAAQIAADEKVREDAERNSPQARRARLIAAREKGQAALRTIDQIRRAVGKPGSSGPVGQIARWVDGTPAADRETAIAALGGILGLDALKELKQASPTGASGMGALNEKEFQAIIDQMGSLSPRQSNEQLLETLRGVERHFKRFLLTNEGLDPDQFEKYGFDPFEEMDAQTHRRRAQAMLRNGASAEAVLAFGDAYGYSFDPEAVKANVGNKGAKVIPDGGEGPHSFVKGVEHVGSRLVSGVEAVPNTLLGTDFDLGNRWHRDLVSRWEGRPVDPAGEMTGRIAAAAIPAFLTRNPALAGAVENTLVNDSRDAMGIAQDAIVGAAAGKAGDVVVRGVSNLISPNVSDPVRRLHQRGVRMTPGQIMGGEAVKQEGLRTTLPIAGQRIQRSIDQSYDDVQHAMGDEILRPGGQTADRSIPPGGAFVKDVNKRGSKLYDEALRGTTLTADTRLGNRILSALSKQRLRPDVAQDVVTDLQTSLSGMFGTAAPTRLSGQEWKAVDSELGKLQEYYRKQGGPYKRGATAIGKVKTELYRSLVRQNPGSKAAEVRNADRVHRGVRILNNAAAREGANNVPSPGQIMGAIKAEAPAGKTAFAHGEAPLQQFASDVQNVMPTYANSRSTDRAIAAVPTTREGMMAHIQGLMAAPLYSEPVQRGFQNMMLRENYTAPGIGNFLRSDATAGARGMLGSVQARDLLNMDPLELQALLEEDARLRQGF